ncbi:MAG: glutamate racemase [Steroidobacteraceae bacterium]
MSAARAPIGVFDSGVGGLTVLAALRRVMPAERYLYLGDTARLPYGTKSPQTVLRYALQASALLVERGVGMLVVACNTAASFALPALRARYPQLPVIGVVEPGAAAAAAASTRQRILVLATEATVRGGAYQRVLAAIRPRAEVAALAAPLLVSLAEEGLTHGPIAAAIVQHYLAPLLSRPRESAFDCLLLGCTHFPLLADEIARAVGPSVTVVDSAATTASAACQLRQGSGAASARGAPALKLMATDNVERFAKVGGAFLGEPIEPDQVETVDLAAQLAGSA